jgi:glutaconate CoA-transferase subunit B
MKKGGQTMKPRSQDELISMIDKIPEAPAKKGEYALAELMALADAHEVRNDDICFAGTGLPLLGLMAANMLHAPHALLIYESGVCDGKTMHIPMSVADHRAAYLCTTIGTSEVDTFGFYLQRGYVSLGFLGGAAIDKYGGVNVTCIGGEYYKPKHRLTGSGGNADIGTLATRTVYIMLQESRRFVERNDFTTTPGWWCWDWKTKEWKPKKEVWANTPFANTGPSAVVTNMGVYRFDENGVMYLDSVHPGVTVDQIKKNCAFDINVSRLKGETQAPTYRELFVLREVVDPERIYLTSGIPDYPKDIQAIIGD